MANNITRWVGESPPNILLAIDPGFSYPHRDPALRVPYAGCAMFQWGELAWAALVKCPTKLSPYARMNMLVRNVCEAARLPRHGGTLIPHRGKGQPRKRRVEEKIQDGEGINVLAVEQPILYTRGPAKPQDIINLRGIYGAFMGGIDADVYVGTTPGEWKGSVEGKEILNERVLTILNAAERCVLLDAQRAGEGGLSDHVIDGVGLGLFVLGRMDVGGVV